MIEAITHGLIFFGLAAIGVAVWFTAAALTEYWYG